MAVYLGFRSREGIATVTVGGQPLRPYPDPAHHADVLDWHHPDGALQLALAILTHHCGSNAKRALALHRAYRDHVVMHLPYIWALDSDEVEAAVLALEILTGERLL